MSKVESTITHAGPIQGGYGGIDGDFMVKNGLVLVLAVSEESEGAIMLHPYFDRRKGARLIPLIEELNRQAKEVLSGMAATDVEILH